MPTSNYIEKLTGIKEAWIKNLTESASTLLVTVQLPQVEHTCPKCKSSTRRIKDYYMRHIHHTTIGLKSLKIQYRQRRYKCHCGHTFNEESPFATKYFRTSPALREIICFHLRQVKSYKDIAQLCHVTVSQVIRIFKEISISRPATLPAILSIDEFKGNAAGQKYQVLITDPIKRTILDILPKRTTPALIQYFRQFPLHIRRNVSFITMDMSLQFRKVMKALFPHARIVADRFHLFLLVQWAMERVRKAEQKRLTLHSRTFKSNKRILTKSYEKLTANELIKLEGILGCSPRLRQAYGLKYAFSKVLQFTEQADIDWALHAWLDLVKSANLPEMNSLLHTFTYWKDEIIAALRYSYSNGFTEGCNNKIKVLKRVSFGLRNFIRFRTRIFCI